MQLYTYWRSSAAYRVRIALNLKNVAYEPVPINLVDGAQRGADYLALNPAGVVPALVLDDGTILTQSLAIMDWLDAAHPDPALLPVDPLARARVMAAAHTVAIDIHPINNLRVINHLGDTFGADGAAKQEWMRHWMALGFGALEQMVTSDTPYAFGDTPGLADICLTAQYYNARRWGLDLAPYPRLTEIEQNCLALDAFAKATPEAQPDAT